MIQQNARKWISLLSEPRWAIARVKICVMRKDQSPRTTRPSLTKEEVKYSSSGVIYQIMCRLLASMHRESQKLRSRIELACGNCVFAMGGFSALRRRFGCTTSPSSPLVTRSMSISQCHPWCNVNTNIIGTQRVKIGTLLVLGTLQVPLVKYRVFFFNWS